MEKSAKLLAAAKIKPHHQKLGEPLQSNLFKSANWSPDGSSILTLSEDNALHTFICPKDLQTAAEHVLCPYATVHSPEQVYSSAWYPNACLIDPASFCFLAAPRDHPIQLYDALGTHVRASYPLINHIESFTAPYSLAFSSPDYFYAGSDALISLFSLHRPSPVTFFRTKCLDFTQKGPISALDTSTDILAAGSFSAKISLYDQTSNTPISVFDAVERSGVTQVVWRDKLLLVASRKSDLLEVWDVRFAGHILATLTTRNANTNCRMNISVHENNVFAGGTDGHVRCWDLSTLTLKWSIKLHKEPVTSAAIHPKCPLLATCSGRRYFEIYPQEFSQEVENSLLISDIQEL